MRVLHLEAENAQLRMENAYLEKLKSLVAKRENPKGRQSESCFSTKA